MTMDEIAKELRFMETISKLREKWLEPQEERPYKHPNICEDCMKSPCKCEDLRFE